MFLNFSGRSRIRPLMKFRREGYLLSITAGSSRGIGALVFAWPSMARSSVSVAGQFNHSRRQRIAFPAKTLVVVQDRLKLYRQVALRCRGSIDRLSQFFDLVEELLSGLLVGLTLGRKLTAGATVIDFDNFLVAEEQ